MSKGLNREMWNREISFPPTRVYIRPHIFRTDRENFGSRPNRRPMPARNATHKPNALRTIPRRLTEEFRKSREKVTARLVN